MQTMDWKLLVLIALYVSILEIGLYLWKRKGTIFTPKEKELRVQMAELIKKERKLNSIDTFVQHSKVQREINRLKKEQDQLAIDRMKNAQSSEFMKRLQMMIRPVSILFLTNFYWGRSVMTFHSSQLVPFTRMMALPGGSYGSVTVVAWYFICGRVIQRLLR